MIRRSLAILVFAAASVAASASAQSLSVPFQGEIVDESLLPVSGVFPMTFNMYAAEGDTVAVWTEQHFVAVWEGQYEVVLGNATPFVGVTQGQSVIVGVELGTFGEVARQALVLEPASETAPEPETVTGLVYAHIADHAVEAESAVLANDCETLGGRTAEELDRFDELNDEINSLRREVADATETRLGSRTVVLDRIGGPGGIPYEAACPAGHVVTGVRGRAGDLIDALEMICSPLQ